MVRSAIQRGTKSPFAPFNKGGWGDLKATSLEAVMTITIADGELPHPRTVDSRNYVFRGVNLI
jgi:hypothetical protein